MISLWMARKLKAAGLVWKPVLHDFFAIPDRMMDDKIFVFSDMLATMEVMYGMQVVSFQGASEWALDSLIASEVVWIPTEAQLRQLLEEALFNSDNSYFRLSGNLAEHSVEIMYRDSLLTFVAGDASEAYAQALLHILEENKSSNHV